ncbi:unnamed protein product, partial [Symbiodinium sp. CCMP2456]
VPGRITEPRRASASAWERTPADRSTHEWNDGWSEQGGPADFDFTSACSVLGPPPTSGEDEDKNGTFWHDLQLIDDKLVAHVGLTRQFASAFLPRGDAPAEGCLQSGSSGARGPPYLNARVQVHSAPRANGLFGKPADMSFTSWLQELHLSTVAVMPLAIRLVPEALTGRHTIVKMDVEGTCLFLLAMPCELAAYPPRPGSRNVTMQNF